MTRKNTASSDDIELRGQEEGGAEGTLRDRAKAETWRRIARAAREVFVEQGYRATSIQSIADRAGIAKASVYRHVDSKADLYGMVYAIQAEEFDRGFAIAIERGNTARERLENVAEWYVDFFLQRESRLRGWAFDDPDLAGEITPAGWQAYQQEAQLRLGHFAELISSGVKSGEFIDCDPWVVANLLWRMGDAFCDIKQSPARADLLGLPLAAAFRQGFGIIIRGICK